MTKLSDGGSRSRQRVLATAASSGQEEEGSSPSSAQVPVLLLELVQVELVLFKLNLLDACGSTPPSVSNRSEQSSSLARPTQHGPIAASA